MIMENEVHPDKLFRRSNISSHALFAGACAGFAVDVTLFPIDTIKTRLQSKQGFIKGGGLRNIYAGLGPVMIGSAPGAAVFFVAYENFKRWTQPFMPVAFAQASAASLAEVFACLVRVPTEVVKQRAQANKKLSPRQIFGRIIATDGYAGLYRGYRSTLLREIPFSFIQLPLWEQLKEYYAKRSGKRKLPNAFEAACCGSIAGGIASAITTPLDVAKTRIMLAERVRGDANLKIYDVLHDVYVDRGFRALFAGIGPRVAWISLGGFVFFGTYELILRVLKYTLDDDQRPADHNALSWLRYKIIADLDEYFVSSRYKNEPKTWDEMKREAKEQYELYKKDGELKKS